MGNLHPLTGSSLQTALGALRKIEGRVKDQRKPALWRRLEEGDSRKKSDGTLGKGQQVLSPSVPVAAGERE